MSGMRRFLILALLTLVTGAAATVNANVASANGCTPGYFKNHAFPNPTATLSSVFNYHEGTTVTQFGAYANTTLQDALSLQGGPGMDGALQILFRTATAAYLNSTAPFVYSGPNTAEIKYSVWYLTNFGTRDDILAYAALLDGFNNSTDGCPNVYARA